MLDEEVALFGKMKPELLRDHNGKFALIKGEQFVGAYESVEDAYSKGVKRFWARVVFGQNEDHRIRDSLCREKFPA